MIPEGRGEIMETLLKDIRYGLRTLFKSPGITIVALASLALGIGANTAIFSIVNSFILAPLPVEQPKQLISVFTADTKNPGNLPMSHLNYEDYRDRNDVFTGVLAYTYAALSWNDYESKQVGALVVSGNYFDVLGVKAALGRTFLPEEDKTPGTHPVVVISYGFWQRSLGSDPGVIGKSLKLNRHDFTVIGVAAKDFIGTELGGGPDPNGGPGFSGGPDVWVPMMMHDQVQPDFDYYNQRRGLFLFLIGRLRPGVSVRQAQAGMATLASQLEQEYPKENQGRTVKLLPLLQARLDPDGSGQLMLISGMLMVAVGIVLLIACANVANLLLARAVTRRKEIAIRLAIGASRRRLFRQLLTEGVLLSFLGGMAGFFLAFLTKDILRALDLFSSGPYQPEPGLNLEVLGFTMIITVLSGLISGLFPAMQASSPDLVLTLKGERNISVGRKYAFNLRKALVVAQIALSLVSLIVAGLFVRTLQNARAINAGFRVDNLMLFDIDLGREGYTPAQGISFHQRLVERLQSLPGVQAATVALDRPMSGGFRRSIFIEGQEPETSAGGTLIQTTNIGLRYFEAMGTPFVAGRDFSDVDTENAPLTAIINETMARHFWPDQQAVGKRFKFFRDQDYREVIGVVKDTKYNSLVEEPRPFIYLPLAQDYASPVAFHVRTGVDARTMVAAVRNEVKAMDQNLPAYNLEMLDDHMEQSLGGQQKGMSLLISFGGLALLLATVGLYGLMAYSVTQRTREIGIRIALGAQRWDVVKMVLDQGIRLISVGVVVGLIASFIVTHLIASLLFGVSAVDPATFAATSLLLVIVALLASYVPAHKATRVDPLIALKSE
jgi:predicted permease